MINDFTSQQCIRKTLTRLISEIDAGGLECVGYTFYISLFKVIVKNEKRLLLTNTNMWTLVGFSC